MVTICKVTEQLHHCTKKWKVVSNDNKNEEEQSIRSLYLLVRDRVYVDLETQKMRNSNGFLLECWMLMTELVW